MSGSVCDLDRNVKTLRLPEEALNITRSMQDPRHLNTIAQWAVEDEISLKPLMGHIWTDENRGLRKVL